MVLRSVIIGMLFTVALVTVLAVTRIFDTKIEDDEVKLQKVETYVAEEVIPPPDMIEEEPPDEVEPEVEEMTEEITLEEAAEDFSVDQPNVKVVPIELKLNTSMQIFNTDHAPAALPTVAKVGVVSVKPPVRTVKRPYKETPKRTKPRLPKAYYGASELDGLPRELSKGRFVWPRAAKGRSGTVKLLIEIGTSGRVNVIRVVSSSNKALNSVAMRVAKGSRYSIPKFKGKAVKTRFFKTYNLQKPR